MFDICDKMTDRLQKINKFITIPKSDRQSRTKEFNEISARVVQQLKEQDPFFGLLYKGWRLGGSYADNLKVKKADEFDLVLQLKINEDYYDVKVTKRLEFPGFCTIQLTEKLHCKGDKYQTFMSGLLDDEGFLIENKFNDWFNKLMQLVAIKNKSLGDSVLTYSRSGPAQTVTATSKKHGQTSYDFVPAFIFDPAIRAVERKISDEIAKIIPSEDMWWIALPKPLKECPEGNKSFLTSFVNIERHFLKDKRNLKNTLRMMKKFRDVKDIKDLKSYFIKTIYLWENETQNRDFWKQPAIDVLKHMFHKSIEYFENKNLPFFWHVDQNMIANLNQVNIDFILHHLRGALHKLETEPDKIYDIFLTHVEQQELESNNNLADAENASSEDYEIEDLEDKCSTSGTKIINGRRMIFVEEKKFYDPFNLPNTSTVNANASSEDDEVENVDKNKVSNSGPNIIYGQKVICVKENNVLKFYRPE